MRSERAGTGTRVAAEEVPVALVYDASTHAVLMASPCDLEDLAIGFSLTEGIVATREGIADLTVVEQAGGIELRMWLSDGEARTQRARRRAMLGPSGCGLCGVESLDGALPRLAPVTATTRFPANEIARAVATLADHQPLGAATRAVHAAGLWRDGGFVAVREDVGRHNALDKLAGALADDRRRDGGLVVLTSRVSVEMVQKAARIGVGGMAAISAPTALAVRVAEAAGIMLAAVVRDDGFEVFSRPERLLDLALA